MGNINFYFEGLNCNGGSNSVTKTTSEGVEYRKANGNTSEGLEVGDIGTNAILTDGSHLFSGIYNGGIPVLAAESWDNIITN